MRRTFSSSAPAALDGLPHDLRRSVDGLKNRFMFMAGYEDEVEFDRFIAGFDLRERVSMLTCPCFALGGALDKLAPISNTYELMPRIPGPVELVNCENERHAR